MKFKEDDQKITVQSYDAKTGYFDCVAEDGSKHMIDLQLCAAYPDAEPEWFIGKIFFARVVPYHSFASELRLV